MDYFAGKLTRQELGDELSCEDAVGASRVVRPRRAPAGAWTSRASRPRGCSRRRASCSKAPMQPDIEASIEILRAFNRWIDDDWGFAYQNRIFGVPFLHAVRRRPGGSTSCEWCLDHGARSSRIRHGAACHGRRHAVAGRSDVRPLLGSRRRRRASSSRRTPVSRTATPTCTTLLDRVWGGSAQRRDGAGDNMRTMARSSRSSRCS